MKKHWLHIILALATMGALVACNPDAHYFTNGVTLTLSVKQVSAGFVEVNVEADLEAYFLVGIIAQNGYDQPAAHPKQFMTLMRDSAYVDYLDWRYRHLRDGEDYIADFASHSLSYTRDNRFFYLLNPDTDYYIFAFVVDPITNEPFGYLYLLPVTTASQSTVRCTFDYRVDGQWDYVYPRDTDGHVLSTYPYAWITVDSLLLDSLGVDYMKYAIDTYQSWYASGRIYDEITQGVAGTNNLLDPEYTFREGHTYYALIAGMDGGISDRNRVCYRFRWEGEATSLYLRYPDDAKPLPDSWLHDE